MNTIIRDATAKDAAGILAIYNPYIAHSHITFETDVLEPPTIIERLHTIQSQGLPWLVADVAGQVAGYAYASPWKARAAYRFSVESAIYVHDDWSGQGIGSSLYRALLERLRQQSIHSVLAGIAQPNDASVALHEKLGFVKVAHLPEVGYKFERWIDVAYWQHNFKNNTPPC